MTSNILNFLTRTVIALVLGQIINIMLAVSFLYLFLMLDPSGENIQKYLLFLSYAIATIISFTIPTRYPLFKTDTSLLTRAGIIALAVLILMYLRPY